MVNNLPVAKGCRSKVFGAIVNIDDIAGAMAGNSFGDVIDARVWLHDLLFERKDVGVEVREKGKGAQPELGVAGAEHLGEKVFRLRKAGPEIAKIDQYLSRARNIVVCP